MAAIQIPAGATLSPPTASDEDGMIKNILDGFRSIPHFGNAISRGIDEPGISADERAMRQRSMQEAASWVLPILAGGGAGLFLKGIANPAIRFALQAGIGNAVGAGSAAAIGGGDTGEITQSALVGGALGGLGGFAAGGAVAGKAASAAMAADDAAATVAAKSKEIFNASDEVISTLGAKVEHAPGGGVQLSSKPIPTGQVKPALTEFGLDSPGIQQSLELPLPRTTVQQELFPSKTPLLQPNDRYPAPLVYTGKLPGADKPGEQLVLGNLGVPKVGEQLGFEFVPQPRVATSPVPGGFDQVEMFPEILKGQMRKEVAASVGAEAADAEISARVAQELTGVPGTTSLTATPGAPSTPFTKHTVRKGQKVVELPGDDSPFSPAQHLEAVAKETEKAFTSPKWLKRGKELTAPVWDDLSNMMTAALLPTRKLLSSFGPTGAAFAGKMDLAMENWRKVAGPELVEVEAIFKPFTKKADRVHIGEIMEGLAKARTPEHQAAADAASTLYARIFTEVDKRGMRQLSGGTKQATEKLENYLTHYVDEDAVKKMTTPGSPQYNAVIAEIRKQHPIYDEKSAAAMLGLWSKTPSEFRTGPINFARTLNLPYEKDPLKVVSRYVYTVRRRLSIAEQFGADNNGALTFYAGIANEVGEQGGKRAMAQAKQAFDAFSGALPSKYPKFVQAATLWNTMTMLSTSGIVQPAQLFNTAAVVGYGNLVKAIGLSTTKLGKEFADSTGGHLSEVLQDMLGGAYATDPAAALGQKFVKAIGLEPLDKWNRVVSALAGRLHAEDVATKFVKAPKNKILAEKLERMGINPAEVIASGGKLDKAQLLTAGRRVSLNTQFASDVNDLPLFKNGDLGRLLYQFKSFGLQQTNFVAGLVKQAKKGDTAPLLRWAGGIGVAGQGIGPIIRGFKGYAPPDAKEWEIVENLAMAGTWGATYDAYKALSGGPGAFTNMLVGPSGGELANFLAKDLPAAAKGDPTVLAKHLVKRIPIIGQPLANYWLFPK